MSELRRDPLLRRWTIIAPERRAQLIGRRLVRPLAEEEVPCPFCPGNEHLNPQEIYVARANGPRSSPQGWAVRITPDRQPLLRVEGAVERRGVGLFDLDERHRGTRAGQRHPGPPRALGRLRPRTDGASAAQLPRALQRPAQRSALPAGRDHEESRRAVEPLPAPPLAHRRHAVHSAPHRRRVHRRARVLPAQGALRLLRCVA